MNAPRIRRLDSTEADFEQALTSLLQRDPVRDAELEELVREILADVGKRGDAALLDFTLRFDRLRAASAAALEIAPETLQRARAAIPREMRETLDECAQRIRDYHQRQKPVDWQFEDAHGSRLGQLVRPLQRVGVYVPGGRASYPSTVLMNTIPARVAGVEQVVMTVPAPDGALSEVVLAAAATAGVDRVFTVGGAQAIAALAFGTETIPRVDKIVGPGNRFVAEAKRQVYGRVGLDMVAGPSEVLVISDGSTPADWIVLDLFAQAEHDEDAQAILLSPDADFLERVAERIAELLPAMPRASIIAGALGARGALVRVRDLDQALELSNRIAPEHLELALERPEPWLEKVRHAGAVFLGSYSAEVLGDYCAGPSHVLPTAGTARFSSPLDVHDFVKRSSIIHCSREGAAELARLAARLADSEGLPAHAGSARFRIPGEGESR